MDPNEALGNLRRLMTAFGDEGCMEGREFDLRSGDEFADHCDVLKDQWLALDEWLSSEGTLPRDWQRKSKVPTTEEAFAAGVRGEHPTHFAMRVAAALTKEYADHQKRILRSLDRSPDGMGVMLDIKDQMACVQLEELGLVAGGDYVLTENDGDWRYYFVTEAGKALVKAWKE